jgi:hypothetical protein
VFRVEWFYPWIDGWHYTGALHVDDTLYGERQGNQPIPFRWLQRYGNGCLVCDRVSAFNGKSGIWFLAVKNGVWRLSGTAATMCGGPLPLDTRNALVNAVERKKTRE